MSWVRVPPEYIYIVAFFSLSMEKELFRLVVLPRLFMYVGLRFFMFGILSEHRC